MTNRLAAKFAAMLLVLSGLQAIQLAPAFACSDSAQGGASNTEILIGLVNCQDGSTSDSSIPVDQNYTYQEVKWIPACAAADVNSPTGQVTSCEGAQQCLRQGETRWFEYAREVHVVRGVAASFGEWTLAGVACWSRPPPPVVSNVPIVTPDVVLRAIRRVGLPALTVRVQPDTKTLVNLPTYFYTKPKRFSTTITLLGQQVDVLARPSKYGWHFGDGQGATTTTAGAPYPDGDVTHPFTDAHVTVRPSVDVVYTASFRIAGGSWQAIPETITIPGPTTQLYVAEATPALSGQHH